MPLPIGPIIKAALVHHASSFQDFVLLIGSNMGVTLSASYLNVYEMNSRESEPQQFLNN